MPPIATNRRIEFIDAYRDLVLERGERGATLDALAKHVGASKGGLLHHFPSKSALVDGLCERFTELVAEDIADLPSSGLTPTEWYLGTSNDYTAPLERTMSALIRLSPSNEAKIRPVLRRARAQWYSIILADVGDAVLAKAIILLGDGIAYNAETYGTADDSEFTDSASVERVVDLIALLREQRASRPDASPTEIR